MSAVRYDAPWIVGHQTGEHRLLRDGCVVVDGGDIVYVGPRTGTQADRVVNCPGKVITPGFISTHSHLQESPADKSIAEDVDRRRFWGSGIYEVLIPRARALSADDTRACVDFSIIEHLRTGTTTVVQLGDFSDYVADAAESGGIRAYIGESYRSASWRVDGRQVLYDWDEPGGFKGLEAAVALIKRIDGRANDRIRGLLYPAQIDTCSEDLLRASREAADKLGVPLTLHAAQSMLEFIEIRRRYGRTPVEWLHDIGFLGKSCILGHVIFIAGSSYVNYPGDDLALLAASGTSVSYSAWCFARGGIALESYPSYLERGVNVCLGTDTCPQSMIESLRWTAVLGKCVVRRSDRPTARQVFDSATVNAARALGRDDLGRIAEGAKADLLFWRADSLSMTPLRDPIRNIVYCAQADDLRDVMIDGRWVMHDGELAHLDEERAIARVKQAGERVWAQWAQNDWAGRELDDLSPPSYPDFEPEA